jgi:DNA invertase Pin-like site-specific DNA recombinase
MQQNACREFIAAMSNWKFECDYIEKGVSGYKKSVAERDVLQDIKRDAELRRFDILLVFMFDRLGRREDEIPFMLEWFVSHGIEVWSVKEGHLHLENRVDKLMNYIRFWQSGGESEKTGVRVKEKHTQMIREGKFCGGIAPYGYKLIPSGVISNKGRLLKKPVIDESEAEIVRLVYKLATENGYGGQRIAAYLNEQNIPTRKGANWGLTVVNYMLRNPIYKGYPTYGKTTAKSGSNKRNNPADWLISEVKIDELAIIDEAIWDKAQIIRTARTPEKFKTENIDYTIPLQTKSPLLLTGLITCGHCGSTLSTYTSVSKWNTKDGPQRSVHPSYRCTSVNRGIKCNGQATYSQARVEEPVLDEIYRYLDSLEAVDLRDRLAEIRSQTVNKEETALRAVTAKIVKLTAEIEKLNTEIISSISGDSAFTPEQLATALRQQSAALEKLNTEETSIRKTIDAKLANVNKFSNLQKMVPNWREEFQKAGTDVRKMLISELLDSVVISRDRIEVNFKVSFDDFTRMS